MMLQASGVEVACAMLYVIHDSLDKMNIVIMEVVQ